MTRKNMAEKKTVYRYDYESHSVAAIMLAACAGVGHTGTITGRGVLETTCAPDEMHALSSWLTKHITLALKYVTTAQEHEDTARADAKVRDLVIRDLTR